MIEMRYRRFIVKFNKTALTLAIFITTCATIVFLLGLGDSGSLLDFQKQQIANKQASKLSTCPVLSIHSKRSLDFNTAPLRPLLCSLPELTGQECSEIKAAFRTNPGENTCDGSSIEMCEVRRGRVECHNNECSGHEAISVGLLDPITGRLFWTYYTFLLDVEEMLNAYIKRGTDDYFPFCFLKCDEFWSPNANSQLLLLPPRTLSRDLKDESNTNKDPHKLYNINIILLDSVSRPHFYRSLPKTIKVFQDINSHSHAHVLDFELMHALKSRTFENLNALFSGNAIHFHESFNGLKPNPEPIAAHIMFKTFRRLGYQTLWQDDVCWLSSEWGIARDLSVVNFSQPLHERWANLKRLLKQHGVSHSGITHSACEVSRKYNVPQFFNNPHKICYGGHVYHKFFLDHVEDLLNGIATAKAPVQPLLSLTLLNIGHEGSGHRIQQLDASLASFVKKLAQEQNTFSIILSDHGNSYGNFTKTVAGRSETFQPHLFLVIPGRISGLLGKERLHMLQQNQRRLISIQDLHFTIMSLFNKESNNSGLFQPISSNRTCQDLPLIPPFLCVCQGWESRVSWSPVHPLIAEFALGKLNELLQKHYTKTSKAIPKSPILKSIFGSCEKLTGRTFNNIRERRSNGSFITSMHLYVQKGEVFNVEVEMVRGAHISLNMQLKSFTRLSEYGIYRTCADDVVPPELCVCEINRPVDTPNSHLATGHPVDNSDKSQPHPSFINVVFGSETRVDNLHEKCLFLLLREYSSGVTLEVSNICAFVIYEVELVLSLQNMQTSGRVPVKANVKPGTLQFLMVVIQLDLNVAWNWQYTFNFSWKMLR